MDEKLNGREPPPPRFPAFDPCESARELWGQIAY